MIRWVNSASEKGNVESENGLCFCVAEAALIPLVVVVRTLVGLIRLTLFAAIWTDHFIAKSRGRSVD